MMLVMEFFELQNELTKLKIEEFNEWEPPEWTATNALPERRKTPPKWWKKPFKVNTNLTTPSGRHGNDRRLEAEPHRTAVVRREEGRARGSVFPRPFAQHAKQVGPSCVATTLSMVANATGATTTPEDFKAVTNSQAPHTWVEALKPYGLQLAYCNNDVRRLGYFVDELVAYDDLFFLCFYSEDPPSDPQSSGKLCTAHIITLHGDTVYDTAKSASVGWSARPRSTADWRGRPRESSGSSRSIIRGASDEHGSQHKSTPRVRWLCVLRSTVRHRVAH